MMRGDKALIETTSAVTASPAVIAVQNHTQQAAAANTTKDRRAERRYKANPGNSVVYVEGAGTIRDLSMNGIFVLDNEPLEVGTPIAFSVVLGNETASFQGVVRRSVPQEGMAIEFTQVSRPIRRRLVANIACLS